MFFQLVNGKYKCKRKGELGSGGREQLVTWRKMWQDCQRLIIYWEIKMVFHYNNKDVKVD